MACPPIDTLKRLLAGGLNNEERTQAETHVEECSGCQDTLHTLTLGAAWPALERFSCCWIAVSTVFKVSFAVFRRHRQQR
jgi:hypothetical protein